MRLTIKQHHHEYLLTLAAQMGCSPATTIDYLLFELRRQGFTFTSPTPPLPLADMPKLPPLPTSLGFVGSVQPFQEIDPVIERISSLIEEF